MVTIKSENERVQEVRKRLGMTLEKFGQRLGVTKVAISNIEKGHRNVTEQMRKSICREYNVNELWLMSGQGEMFVADEVKHLEIIENYFKSLGFSMEYNVTKWHFENPDEPDPAERVQIPDEAVYILTKGGESAVFTPEEFEELQDRARETIEGIFYKKVVQKNK
ncbi:helix-turn-helix domain-containing protein [Lachnoclostridium sp. An76]|uniref:helix-turn-helix domain-containing protein n=1 Tax=Lachnoclostridium sp. An76 TaxID=1965654 RepID=UPI001FA8FCA1|nr:helix-turn-helix transcriptional regulator [Lachnoclostridium sp. An76]